MTSHRIAALLLTGYAAALALAAIRPEVRPAAIAVPSEGVRVAMRAVGIHPGLAVFETGERDQELVLLPSTPDRWSARRGGQLR